MRSRMFLALLTVAFVAPLPLPGEPEKPPVLKTEEVDPGRRESERAVKGGVDAELQRRIDQVIAKACKYLLDGCSGSGMLKARIEHLEDQAENQRTTAEDYRKQAADLKAKDPAQSAQREQTATSLDQGAKNMEDQIKTLRQSLERKKGAPEPPLYEALEFKFGEEALIGLALVQAGVSPYDPVVQRIWNDQYSQPMPKDHVTYTVSLQLMLADAMMHAPCGDPWPEGRPKVKPKKTRKDKKAPQEVPILEATKDGVRTWIQKRVDVISASVQGGAWSYWLNGVPAAPPKGYKVGGGGPEIGSDELLKMVKAAAGSHDYSNTQYAVLGLKAAALCGVRPREADLLWRQVIQQFLIGQVPEGKEEMLLLEAEGKGRKEKETDKKAKEKDPGFMKGFEEAETGGHAQQRKARARGWGYQRWANQPGLDQARAAMTTAGLTALLVGRSELKLTPKEAEQVDGGVRDGLAWIQAQWALSIFTPGMMAPTAKGADGYLLYGLERVGVLGALRTIGGHDWYAEGARFLVDRQQEDGTWQGGNTSAVSTSLCLLFLTRGTREAYGRSSYEVGELPPEAPKTPKVP